MVKTPDSSAGVLGSIPDRIGFLTMDPERDNDVIKNKGIVRIKWVQEKSPCAGCGLVVKTSNLSPENQDSIPGRCRNHGSR